MLNKKLYKKFLDVAHHQDSNEILNCLACLCSQVAVMNNLDKEVFKATFTNHIEDNWDHVDECVKEFYDRRTI